MVHRARQAMKCSHSQLPFSAGLLEVAFCQCHTTRAFVVALIAMGLPKRHVRHWHRRSDICSWQHHGSSDSLGLLRTTELLHKL
jgi:hypothetical protein